MDLKELDDNADKSVLQEIIKLMGKLNADDLSNMKMEKPADQEGMVAIEAEVLPGEEVSENPTTEGLKASLVEALNAKPDEAEEKGEGDFDEDDDLRRKAKIF